MVQFSDQGIDVSIVLNLRRGSCALDRLTAALTRFSRIVTVISLLLD
jgi:hypothetical protein